jgi:rhamnosyltransferase
VTKIAAIIVVYYPDPVTTTALLAAVRPQVDMIYVVDNTPTGDLGWVPDLTEVDVRPRAVHMVMGENCGIAVAHNAGIKTAIGNHCTHVLLFDQDSSPPPTMVQTLIHEEKILLDNGVRLASIGPAYWDEKTKEVAPAIRSTGLVVRKFKIDVNSDQPVASDHLIASGSLIRVSAIKEIGLMREDLFIDWVDIEWGIRARSMGYNHYICPSALMNHSIGDDYVDVLGKKINLHSDVRNYYIVRNAVALGLDRSLPRAWRYRMLIKAPLYVLFHSWNTAEHSRLAAFKLMLVAAGDGLRNKLGKMLVK